MDVVVYKAKGKNGYLYDISFNPYVDFEILKNTRNIKGLEVLTPKIPIDKGEEILEEIYGTSILKKFISTHDYFINRGLKKLKIKGVNNRITTGVKIPEAEDIGAIEKCITGKVVTVNRLVQMKETLGLTEDGILNIIQLLYCERRIRIIPAIRIVKGRRVCSFCERNSCGECCLGFKNEDILLYAADNYNIGVPRTVSYRKKKLNDSLTKAFEGVNNFVSFSKKCISVLWCVPGAFEYTVLSEALANVIMIGGKILYITSTSLLYETMQELANILEDVNISIANKNDISIKESDIIICAYNDYPCFHKAFDLVIYDERMAFLEAPLKNMLAISNRAVKEKGKLINITCLPEMKYEGHNSKEVELITIPVTATRTPIPEPLIVVSRLLKEIMPEIVIDTIKWSIDDNLKVIIFAPSDESRLNIYNNINDLTNIKKELIDFSTEKDKTAIMRLKRKEIQILISSDLKDVNCVIEDLNVVVMNADDPIYSKELLIYMASMAGQHTKKKCGQVIFTIEKDSEDVTITKERIRGINKIAWENGLLKK